MSQTITTDFVSKKAKSGPSESTETIIIIRTHYMDDDLAQLIESYQRTAGYSVVLAADERNALVDIGPANGKISLTLERYSEFGLHTTDDVMWRCGDYPLYFAIEKYQNAKFFWTIEPDVHINLDRPGLFFKQFAENTDVDFIAARYGRATKDWWWFQSMAAYAPNIYGCLYPITRMSRSAISFLFEKRKEYTIKRSNDLAKHTEDKAVLWPNDEVFASTVLSNGPFLCKDFNEFGTQRHTKDSFHINFPLSKKYLLDSPRDGLVYHPVLSGEQFLRKAYSFLEHQILNEHPPETFEAQFGVSFQRQIRDECGDEAARNFKARYDKGLALCRQRRQADPA